MGLMQSMVTVTHNDNCPEMLASARRGPLAPPQHEEIIEYLLMRRKRDAERPAVEHFSLEHVLSYQRRVKALKHWFMDRNAKTRWVVCGIGGTEPRRRCAPPCMLTSSSGSSCERIRGIR